MTRLALLLWIGVTRRREMRSFWEQTSVLSSIYRLLAKGLNLNDDDIAVKLKST